MSELYDRINQICQARGTNITSLCKKAGVSRAALSELNAGRTKTLSLETAQKLADSLQVSLNFLLGKFDNDEPISFVISADELQEYLAKKKAPVQQDERHVNVVRIAGRDGSYVEKYLTDDQIKALKTIIDQLPEADIDGL